MNASVSSVEVPMPDWCRPATTAYCQTWCDGLIQAITFLYPQPFVVNGPVWVWRKQQDISVGFDYRKKLFIADRQTWTLNHATGTWIIEQQRNDEEYW